jgi:hypothetical protein
MDVSVIITFVVPVTMVVVMRMPKGQMQMWASFVIFWRDHTATSM